MSLDLDERRIAMLAEMGVRVWQPPAEPASVDAAVVPADPAEAPVLAPADDSASRARPGAPPIRAPSVAEPGEAFHAAAPAAARAAPTAAPVEPHVAPRVRIAGDRPAGIARMGWTELQAAVAGCQACKLCEKRRNTVFGVGQPPETPEVAPRVDWMIVGEAPGENEDAQGEPFVGQAGKLLDNMLRAIGLARDRNVFIANVLKCRPPGNRNPEPEEVAQCEPFLRRQVELLQPRIILAMGRFAVQSLLETSEPIGRLRGQRHEYHGVPVVVTYHPAYLLRNLPDKAKAWADLCLALSLHENNSR